jgi:DNA modification methylase
MAKTLKTLADIVLDPRNANKGTARGTALLERSLEEVGAGRGPVVDAEGIALAGNKTIEAWRKKGGKVRFVKSDGSELVVIQREDLSLARAPRKARELAYLDNRTSQVGLAWDAQIIETDRQAGIVEFEELGIFAGQELADLVADVTSQEVATPRDLDDAPEAPRKVTIKRGDLFQLGPHRLMCGDSTKRDDVRRLMDGKRAECMFTDPPYGVLFQSKGVEQRAIQGDLSQSVIPLSFAVAVEEALNQDARVYVCGGQDNAQMYLSLFDHHLRMMPRFIIWDKKGFVLRRNNYHSGFEIVYFGWRGKGGGPKAWYGDRKQSDVWTVARDPGREYRHPTQKPVELSTRALLNSCRPGGLTFEPFSGSGSTMLGAETTKRVCYAMEIDPKYCHVTIDRWQEATGRKAVQIGSKTSKPGKGTR